MIKLFEILNKAMELVNKERLERKDKENRENIASLFNKRYTYDKIYDSSIPRIKDSYIRGGYAWMCPTCNKIHHPVGYSGISGLIYPKCCSHREGARHEYI